MADSSFDTFVDTIETTMGDATVKFFKGTTGKERGMRDQQRRVVIERASGSVHMSSHPVKPNVKNVTKHARFQRNELLRVSLYAEDEDLLDQLFDNFINAVFDCCGPNAFDAENGYEWGGEDSKGGANVVRQPMIAFMLPVRLKVDPPVPLSRTVAETTINFNIG